MLLFLPPLLIFASVKPFNGAELQPALCVWVSGWGSCVTTHSSWGHATGAGLASGGAGGFSGLALVTKVVHILVPVFCVMSHFSWADT